MKLCISVALWSVAASCLAQSPSFQADRVLAEDRSIPLAPGLLLSIYGNDLGPAIGCEGLADQHLRETPRPLRPHQTFVETLIYPKQLCNTQVLVGGIQAGLLYVAAKQINFKVPQEIPIDGTTTLQVKYKGQPSPLVKLSLGLESAILSFESPAKVGMPVWLKISMAGVDQLIQYPVQIWPMSFGCHQVEVRKNGRLLIPFASRDRGPVRVGGLGPCGVLGLPAKSRHLGRLPLHLQYRFDEPGTYEVRYTLRYVRYVSQQNSSPVAISLWTPLIIKPAIAGERARWLTKLQHNAPTSTVELMTDFLPQILGIPDQQSLEILGGYLYHPDNLVRQFARNGLAYWL